MVQLLYFCDELIITKMKQIILILAVIVTATSCQQKIGYIDNGEVINAYQAKKNIEDKFAKKETVIKRKNDSTMQALQLEAQALQAKISRYSEQRQQQEFQPLQQRAQLLQQQMQFEQQQLQQAYRTEIDSAIADVKTFVKDYGKTNGYTYILGTSEGVASVMYGTDENDLTETIIEALNTDYSNKQEKDTKEKSVENASETKSTEETKGAENQ